MAIIGASRRQGAIGRQVVANMLGGGFAGPVYPVNPKAQVVHSVPAFKSVASIPGPVDLAVLVVPADAVLRVAEQCGAKGVKGLVVVTAGFGEIGGKGIARETKLGAIAESYGMRVIGPNCMGVINTEPDVRLNATFAATLPEAGPVAMVSQSGALGEAILADATEAGLGVAMFASVGIVSMSLPQISSSTGRRIDGSKSSSCTSRALAIRPISSAWRDALPGRSQASR